MQEEEEGSDDECVTEELTEPCRPAGSMTNEDEGDSDPAFVSPMDEVKAVRHPPRPPVTMANLHEASRYNQETQLPELPRMIIFS